MPESRKSYYGARVSVRCTSAPGNARNFRGFFGQALPAYDPMRSQPFSSGHARQCSSAGESSSYKDKQWIASIRGTQANTQASVRRQKGARLLSLCKLLPLTCLAKPIRNGHVTASEHNDSRTAVAAGIAGTAAGRTGAVAGAAG